MNLNVGVGVDVDVDAVADTDAEYSSQASEKMVNPAYPVAATDAKKAS